MYDKDLGASSGAIINSSGILQLHQDPESTVIGAFACKIWHACSS